MVILHEDLWGDTTSDKFRLYIDDNSTPNPELKKMNTTSRNFPLATWKIYGTIGRSEKWLSNGYDNSHINIGDIVYLTGTASDTFDESGNPLPVTLFYRATEKASNGIVGSSLALQYGTVGIIANLSKTLHIDSDPNETGKSRSKMITISMLGHDESATLMITQGSNSGINYMIINDNFIVS